MRIRNTVSFFLLFISQLVCAQVVARVSLIGVVRSEKALVSNVNIVNLATNELVIADIFGGFSVLVKEGDVLVFSAVGFERLQLMVSKQYFEKNFISLTMVQENIELDEVVVTSKSKITAISLGIVPEDQKKYTQMERKLQTAGDFKPIMLLGLLGGSMPLDPLINKINGRTKRIKKEIIIERKNNDIEKLNRTFEADFFLNKLGVPLDYIEGFKFYIVENNTFVTHLRNNNKAMVEFMIIELAAKYKEIIACENE